MVRSNRETRTAARARGAPVMLPPARSGARARVDARAAYQYRGDADRSRETSSELQDPLETSENHRRKPSVLDDG